MLLLYDIYNPTSWTWEINQGDILNFVSVKYAFAVHENELPSDGFVKIEDFYGINMYENLNYRSVANTYDELITYNEYKEYNDISLINNKIICHDYDYLDISEYLTNTSSYEAFNINKYQNGIDFSIKSDEKTFVVTSIPFDKGWNVIVDNEHTTIYKVNGGFVGFGIENQGIHSISMSFMPSGFKEGLLMTVSGLIILVGLIVFERSQK